MSQTKRIGRQGEELVAHELKQKGYAILARNYIKAHSEIDIIAEKGHEIIFVEVKARNNPLFDPAEQISRAQQKRIIVGAKYFLATYTGAHEISCRFDVALVVRDQGKISITYMENAFME